MNLRIAFLANAVITTFFGLGFLLAPDIALGGFGVVVTPAVALMSRFMGGVVLGNALISFLVANQPPSSQRNIIALGFTIWHAFGALLALQAVATGVFNPMGIMAVVLDGALTVLLAAGALSERGQTRAAIGGV
jgi:hypothetical protein